MGFCDRESNLDDGDQTSLTEKVQENRQKP